MGVYCRVSDSLASNNFLKEIPGDTNTGKTLCLAGKTGTITVKAAIKHSAINTAISFSNSEIGSN